MQYRAARHGMASSQPAHAATVHSTPSIHVHSRVPLQALPRQPDGPGAGGCAERVDQRGCAHHRGHHRLWHGWVHCCCCIVPLWLVGCSTAATEGLGEAGEQAAGPHAYCSMSTLPSCPQASTSRMCALCSTTHCPRAWRATCRCGGKVDSDTTKRLLPQATTCYTSPARYSSSCRRADALGATAGHLRASCTTPMVRNACTRVSLIFSHCPARTMSTCRSAAVCAGDAAKSRHMIRQSAQENGAPEEQVGFAAGTGLAEGEQWQTMLQYLLSAWTRQVAVALHPLCRSGPTWSPSTPW